MNTTTEMQLVDIDKLIPYLNNARTHSKEQITKLRSSLMAVQFNDMIITIKRNENEFVIILGFKTAD